MPTLVNCPSCERKLRVPDDLLGQKVKCPTCATTFDAVTGPSGATLPPLPPLPDRASAMDETLTHPGPAPQRPAESPPLTEKTDRYPCPYCGEQIARNSRRCRFCDEEIEGEPERDEGDDEESNERPWERGHPAFVRRDCEPHRGGLILTLGIISLASLAAVTCVIGLLGLPLGICAWVMGGRDLRKIKNGEMDPQGQGQTQAGWICGIIGTILQSLAALGCVGYVGFSIYMMQTTMNNMKNMPRPAPPVQQQGPVVPQAPNAKDADKAMKDLKQKTKQKTPRPVAPGG